MNEVIEQLLTSEPIGVLSVLLADGTLHAATIHFSQTVEPFKLYMQTSNTTIKAQPFVDGKTGPAALVIGVSEATWRTLQLHGTVRAILDPEEIAEVAKIHYEKHPEAGKYQSPKNLFLEFTPSWWRYSDFNTDPPTIIASA